MRVRCDGGQQRLPGIVLVIVVRADAPLAVPKAIYGRVAILRLSVRFIHRPVADTA